MSPVNTRKSLLLLIRDSSNHQDWSVFYQIYLPLLVYWCVRNGLQQADAEDVVTAVMTKVSKAIRTFQYDPAKGRFRDWLYKITRHEIADFWDRQNRDRRGLDELCNGLDQLGAERLLPSVREHLVGEQKWRSKNSLEPLPVQPEENEQAWVDEFQKHLFREAVCRLRDENELDERAVRVVELWWKNEENGPAQSRAELHLSYQREASIRSEAIKQIKAKMLELGEDAPWLQMP